MPLHLLSPKGFRASGVKAGIKKSGKPDVAILACDSLAMAGALFTRNTVRAAPIDVGFEHIRSGKLRGIVVNAGNANACTGEQGITDAREMCARTARHLGCDATQILPSSTGVIGHLLPMEKVRSGIDSAFAALGNSAEHADAFCSAILTTDLVKKEAATSFKIGKTKVTIAGVCKGSGMIGPRLSVGHATMLAYITTDIIIPPSMMNRSLIAAAQESFNNTTVDDHASTNDTLALLASGYSGKSMFHERSKFQSALNEVCISLAKQIAADGEGATKLVTIRVSGCATRDDARAIARAIAASPLVKCALHGNDPNWGRIVSAAGMCGVEFDPNLATLKLAGTRVFAKGRPLPFDDASVSAAMNAKTLLIDLACNAGEQAMTFYTCDLSKEYVSINADYTT